MNAYDYLMKLGSIMQNNQVPALLDPLRNAGGPLADQIQSSYTPMTQEESQGMSTPERIARGLAYGGNQMAQGMARAIPPIVSGALSVSPPAQWAMYTQGQPNPVKQLQHAAQGLSPAMAMMGMGANLNGGLTDFNPIKSGYDITNQASRP